MQRFFASAVGGLGLFTALSCGPQYTSDNPADLILLNGEVYTMEESQPWASAVVVTGNTITAVLEDDAEADAYRGPDTEVIDLEGKFVVPGFIDGHVHFNNAGGLINDANLMNVSDNPGLVQEIARLVAILEPGEWITGGLWGAYEEWSLGAESAEEKSDVRWEPDRWIIDDMTADYPCVSEQFRQPALSGQYCSPPGCWPGRNPAGRHEAK